MKMITPEILDPDGKPARRGGMTYAEIEAMTEQAHPDWPRAAVIWQARKLWERWPFIQCAIDVGSSESVGRYLRQRWEAGLGIPLDPEEPGIPDDRKAFVLCMLQDLEPGERQQVLDVLHRQVFSGRKLHAVKAVGP